MKRGNKMPARAMNNGFSLVELMIAVAIISILAAISIPLYQDYILSARVGVMTTNIQSIRALEADRLLRRGAYVEGTYDPANPGATGGLTDVLGWAPGTTADEITYVVACGVDATSPECTRSSAVTVTATHTEGGEVVVTF